MPSPQAAQGEAHSSLLDSLAVEAEQTRQAAAQAVQSASQQVQSERVSRNRRVEEALNRLYKFFSVFAQHVNKVEPAIGRSYRFGRQRVYTNLVCRNAFADIRKQDISETALLDYTTFGVHLCAAKPVVITWPWDQLGELKEQLQKIKVRALTDLELGGKRPRQEWMEVMLAQDFPVQLKFKGNYEADRIDVHALNLEALGTAAFTLELADVTQALMDGLGLFLLARTEQLPEALRRG